MSVEVPPLARTPEEWKSALEPLGGRAFHARQVFRWVQARSVLEPERMTDLPLALRESLGALELPQTLVVADERRAADGTRKLLVRTRDGMTVETVLIPGVTGPKGRLPSPVPEMAAMEEGDDDADEGTPAAEDEPVRVTQCISTQVRLRPGMRLLREQESQGSSATSAPTRSSRRCSSRAARWGKGSG